MISVYILIKVADREQPYKRPAIRYERFKKLISNFTSTTVSVINCFNLIDDLFYLYLLFKVLSNAKFPVHCHKRFQDALLFFPCPSILPKYALGHKRG